MNSPKKSFWPYALIIYFAVFITSLVIWVVFAVHNDQDLVRKDYYAEELQFQKTIDSSARAAASDVKIAYDPAHQTIAINLPTAATRGSVQFYRPSNARLDRQIPIQGPAQSIDVAAFATGLWRLRLTWVANGLDFTHSQSIVIRPPEPKSLVGILGSASTPQSALPTPH